MKKIILLFVAFAAQMNFAQNTFPTTGNVGIGTTNPSEKLEIYNSDTTPGVLSLKSLRNDLQFVDVGRISAKQGVVEVSRIGMPRSGETDTGYFTFWTKAANAESLTEKVRISENGNVGIGTTNPKSKLEITDWTTALTIGSTKNTEAMVDNEVLGAINFYKHYNIGYAGAIKLLQAGGGNQYSPAHLAFYTTGGGNVYTTVPEERMRITASGNIGIGTATPDTKLAVNGTIHSKEVKVDMLGWPDYVFKKEYNLPTLEEVEKHINEKGHLQNIPSEEEVLKNGINLGEMNAKLLQKMEEMTLYMIEMKKENEAVKKENALMKKNQIELEKRILKNENN